MAKRTSQNRRTVLKAIGASGLGAAGLFSSSVQRVAAAMGDADVVFLDGGRAKAAARRAKKTDAFKTLLSEVTEYYRRTPAVGEYIAVVNNENGRLVVQFDLTTEGFAWDSTTVGLEQASLTVAFDGNDATAGASFVEDSASFDASYFVWLDGETPTRLTGAEVKSAALSKNAVDLGTQDATTQCIGCDPELNCDVCRSGYNTICGNQNLLCSGLSGLGPQAVCLLIGVFNVGAGAICVFFVYAACDIDCNEVSRSEFCDGCETSPLL